MCREIPKKFACADNAISKLPRSAERPPQLVPELRNKRLRQPTLAVAVDLKSALEEVKRWCAIIQVP
jgi:hypothetical protein